MDDEELAPPGVQPPVPEDAPEWSVPSPWTVAAPPIRLAPPPPPPAPVHRRPNRLTAALVVALVMSLVTAAWAAVHRLDIHFSRPTLSASPAPKPGTGARGGRFSPQPFRPAQPGSAPNIDVNAVAAKVQPGVVDVYTQLASGVSGAGTGVLLTPEGVVLTHNHVIDGSTSITVVHISTGRRYSAPVVAPEVGSEAGSLMTTPSWPGTPRCTVALA